ncbi:hypothetical protein [Sphingomonas sp. CCH10-B3]|uniref:hypothetical protein n=1 Tax=Sphingomonas sp. CCH10-B3 TaxID=1768757 RepID=UPI00082F9863|nr:hypothetical protein [Sphingomonas sp. CCH10-B3]
MSWAIVGAREQLHPAGVRRRNDPIGRRWRRGLAGLAIACLLTSVAAAGPIAREPIDPLTVADADFARHRDPALWRGLSVTRLAVEEGPVSWRMFRIANDVRPDGPLWVVTHDNENATFAAMLVALRSYGGVAIVVDSGASDDDDSARFNWFTGGRPIDPNRHFFDRNPGYVGAVLGDLGPGRRLIVALHTNEPGFDPGLTGCGGERGQGGGNISIRLCSQRWHPIAAPAPRWPFDDEDSVTLVPYRAARPQMSAICGPALVAAGSNVVFERVAKSDGSLSNYAVERGLAYVNVETRERGHDPAGIAAARDRLVAMIDGVMERCGDVPPVRLAAR